MNEHILHEGILNRDAESFEYLMNQYSKLLWVVASGILKNAGTKEDVEECVSECYISLWEHPQKYNPSRGTIKTYLCILARSKALDMIRKLNKIVFVPYDETSNLDETDIGDLLADKELIKKILLYANELKTIDREIFLLRYVYQLKPLEIAAKLNMPVKEISNKLFYSKKCLITNFKGEI